MRIAFAAQYDPRDVRNWSGTPYFMAKGLERAGAVVEHIGPLPEARHALQLARKAAHRLAGRRHLSDREPAVLERWAADLQRRLRGTDADVVLTPSSPPVSYLETELPIVLWSDATFDSLVGFYPEFSNLSDASLENGRRQEEAALGRVALASYSSRWAADGAERAYGVEQTRVAVVPFGANLEPPAADEVLRRIDGRGRDVCRLVIVAADWERKGGDVAVETGRLLNDAGVRTELTIVGAGPPRGRSLPGWATHLGRLDKGSEGQAVGFGDVMGAAHFMLLPTRADCTPVVFAEASAWGTPSLGPDVGGVGEMIADGVNGRLLAGDAGAEDYAAAALAAFEDPQAYRELARSSRREHERRLNWTTAAGTMIRRLEALVGRAAGAERNPAA